MQPNSDVIIVGGGVIGASIAFHLTANGTRRVVVCDQGGFHPSGATAQSAGIIRMHHTNAWQTRLAWQSHATYVHWEDIVGGSCGFRQTGFAFLVGLNHVAHLQNNVSMLREVGVPFLVMTPTDFQAIVPECTTEAIGAVAYEPFSGYADPIQTTRGFLRAARDRGAEFMPGVVARQLIEVRGRVRGIKTNIGDLLAERVVLASNFSATRLVAEFGVDLPVSSKRIGICHIALAPTGRNAPPCIVTDDTLRTYFRPVPPNQVFVGIGPEALEDDSAAVAPIRQSEAKDHLNRLQTRFPSFRAAYVGGTSAAVEGYTPDKHALIGRVGALEGLYVAVGFSGGGFKIAPAVGRAVAAELISQTFAPELEGFRPERFEQCQLIQAAYPYQYL